MKYFLYVNQKCFITRICIHLSNIYGPDRKHKQVGLDLERINFNQSKQKLK